MSQLPTPEQEAMGARIEAMLRANGNRRFVRRIMLPFRAPVMRLPDGNVATHKMAWAEADGKYYVYPTVMESLETGELVDFGDDAFDEALRRRDFIEAASPEEADWFSQNYKSYWDKIGYKPGAEE